MADLTKYLNLTSKHQLSFVLNCIIYNELVSKSVKVNGYFSTEFSKVHVHRKYKTHVHFLKCLSGFFYRLQFYKGVGQKLDVNGFFLEYFKVYLRVVVCLDVHQLP